MGRIVLGGLCGNVNSWDIKYCLAITNFTVTHNGWPFSNFGYPSVYVGSLIGQYGSTHNPSLYNNLAVTSYVKKGATASVNLYFYDFPDKANANESNYTNSDAQITWSSYLRQNAHYGLTYKTSEIKSQAFVDELNNYPMMKEGKKVWMLNPDDGFPCVLKKDFIPSSIDDVIIGTYEKSQGNVREGVFNISGQRLSAPRKGINIINGKKVIVK